MLPKNRRISKKYFPLILSKSKRHNSTHLILYLSPIDSGQKEEQSRFSFSISKKVCPKAVERNKYRRRGYAIISKHLAKIGDGHFYFFSFKKFSSQPTFSILEKEIKELLNTSLMLI